MVLEDLLKTIVTPKTIMVNLYNSENLLLITFNLPGYESISEELLIKEVDNIELPAINSIKITLKAE